MALARPAYRPRDAERGVLHIVVRTHLDTFLREADHRAEGGGLHQFVEQGHREIFFVGRLVGNLEWRPS
ncbi:MAG: hypothetical protein HYU24_03530 [Candidatus Rokubacteria bacterium]|nr:hypothetical protein [Candidatus Rokubacteria bacterium]